MSKTSKLCSWMQSTVQDVFHCNENVFIKHVYMLYLLILISRLWGFIVTSNGNLANHFFIDISIWVFLLFFFLFVSVWFLDFFKYNKLSVLYNFTSDWINCALRDSTWYSPRERINELDELEKYIVIYTWIEFYG